MLTLPDALEADGYRSRLLMSGDHTHFYELSRFYGKHIEEFRDGSSAPGGMMNDDRILMPWLEKVPWATEGPTFVQVHLMSVHSIGVRQPHYEHWQPSHLTASTLLGGSTLDVLYRNNYWNGILQADDLIRGIFAMLETKGVLKDSLIVITADHGEYLGELGKHEHGGLPYEPVVRIPLLIYDPSGRTYPKRALTSQVDIAPTFLYAIGAPVPAWWSGIPLQMSTTRDAVMVGSSEGSGMVVQIGDRRYKYLRDAKTHKESVYDLDAAAEPAGNLCEEPARKPLVDMLRQRYEQLLAQTGPGPIQ